MPMFWESDINGGFYYLKVDVVPLKKGNGDYFIKGLLISSLRQKSIIRMGNWSRLCVTLILIILMMLR